MQILFGYLGRLAQHHGPNVIQVDTGMANISLLSILGSRLYE